MKGDVPPPTRTLVQGTLDMLVLRVLALQPMHGYGVTQRIEQVSQGTFAVQPGSLFPAFRRLERAGLVKSDWRATENNRRAKYYRITDAGKRRLKVETEDWERQTLAIRRILAAPDVCNNRPAKAQIRSAGAFPLETPRRRSR